MVAFDWVPTGECESLKFRSGENRKIYKFMKFTI